jgi:urease accessory protein
MRIIKKTLRGASIAAALTRNAPIAAMPFELRRRSRQKLRLDNGEEVGLALNQGTILSNGDLLIADDGKFIVVHAALESVLRITATTPWQLTRAAYHLGNRHISLEIGADYLQLEHDPVLVEMLKKMEGITVEPMNMPFEPETGAYGGGHKHGHDATFAEDYALAQNAYAAHEHHGGHGHSHPAEHPQHHDDTPE